MKIAVAGATGVVGRYVVEAAHAHGHETVALARAEGVDLVAGTGLETALAGVEAIVDVTNPASLDAKEASRFFTTVVENVERAGVAAGAGHLVTLSIVGIDRAPFGYYAAKLAQERAASAGGLPGTILRATQFHEFCAQQIQGTRQGNRASVFDVPVRTVAARTVARRLVELAERAPSGPCPELTGPDAVAALPDLARRWAARFAPDVEIIADTESAAALPDGALLPAETATVSGPGFTEWLDSADAEMSR